MKTSDKISYEDIFSTDIDVIRRNIEFGTYKEVDPNIIVETNRILHEKIMENTEDAIEEFSDFMNRRSENDLLILGKYFNIYYKNTGIDNVLDIKRKTMEDHEKLLSWVFLNYETYFIIETEKIRLS